MARTDEEARQSKFVKVDEVAQLLDVSESRAYKVMQQLNKELKKKGMIVTSGRVSRSYLEKRCCL